MISVTESPLENMTHANMWTGVRVNLECNDFHMRAEIPNDQALVNEYDDFMDSLYPARKDEVKGIRGEYNEVQKAAEEDIKKVIEEIGNAARTAITAAANRYKLNSRENFEKFRSMHDKKESE